MRFSKNIENSIIYFSQSFWKHLTDSPIKFSKVLYKWYDLQPFDFDSTIESITVLLHMQRERKLKLSRQSELFRSISACD